MLLTIPQAGFLDENIYKDTQKAFDNLIKPVGSLALLENVTCLYAAACRKAKCLPPEKTALLFASDHGVAREGNFLYTVDDSLFYFEQIKQESGALNFLAQKVGAKITVINLGLEKMPIAADDYIAPGTGNIINGPAMSEDNFIRAFMIGGRAVKSAAKEGAKVLCLGSMGAGAEISELALISSLLKKRPAELSADPEQIKLAEQILLLHEQDLNTDNLDIARRLCGFEIPALIGALAQAAFMSIPVFFDGTAVFLAALLLADRQPGLKKFLVPVATTTQAGQKELLNFCDLPTMLDLKLSSGAGEGAILGFSLLDAGIKALNEMDSFGKETVHRPLGDLK